VGDFQIDFGRGSGDRSRDQMGHFAHAEIRTCDLLENLFHCEYVTADCEEMLLG
jgi:hypothetical protein